MNLRIRSNDAYGASFMNMFAFISLGEHVANKVSKRRERKINLGRYVHMADSFHIYGKDLDDFERRLIRNIGTRTFKERTVYRKTVQAIMDEARPKILEKVAKQTAKYETEN